MTESALATNGGSRYQTEKVRVAIVGVGNCASAFVQGVEYYKDANPAERAVRLCDELVHLGVRGEMDDEVRKHGKNDSEADRIDQQREEDEHADVERAGDRTHQELEAPEQALHEAALLHQVAMNMNSGTAASTSSFIRPMVWK